MWFSSNCDIHRINEGGPVDTLENLKKKRQNFEERIKRLENELKKPLTMDPEDNAIDEEDREILNSLYRIEKENLAKIDAEIKLQRSI